METSRYQMTGKHGSAFERLDKYPHRDLWLWVLSAMAVIALFGTVLLFIRDAEQNRQRERDRIEFDAGLCERTNFNQEVIRNIAESSAILDQRVIELLVNAVNETTRNEVTPVDQNEIDRILAPAFAEYQKTVDKIEIVDCKTLLKPSSEGG